MQVSVPFASAEEAWWWAWDAFLLAQHGLPPRRGAVHPPRPCSPADVITRGISHATPLPALVVLAQHGRHGYPPEPGTQAAAIWSAAMADLDHVIRQLGWLTDASED